MSKGKPRHLSKEIMNEVVEFINRSTPQAQQQWSTLIQSNMNAGYSADESAEHIIKTVIIPQMNAAKAKQ